MNRIRRIEFLLATLILFVFDVAQLSAQTFTSTASASPSSITDNVSSTVTITVTNTGSALSDGNVELSIQNSSGTVEATNNWTGVNLAAGAKATYTYTYSPSTLSPGTYELEVGVFNTAWSTDYYWGVDGTITITLPAAPTGLTATAGNASVALSWTASSGATSYNVYRGTTSGGESSTALATGITTTTYTDSTAINGKKYYYEVAAVNSSGTSAKSNEASATPAAPTFTSTASASPSSIYDNGSSTITVTVTDTGSALSDGNVELSIQNSSGTVEATNNWTGVNLAAGGKATYSYTFSPSTLSPALTTPGTYQLEVGVFNTAWTTDYSWLVDGTVTIASSVPALSVSGNTLVDANGNTVILQGVDKMGTEYECENDAVFDNTGLNISNTTVPGAAFIQALASWNVNAVRIPLNEDCWLGINGVSVGGSAYQQPIIDFVNELNQNGMYAILDLHWNAGGTTVPTAQAGMADTDHSPAFWTSVATTFKGNNAVLFDLFNEPYISAWSCWLSGGCSTNGFTVAGMQQLLDNVRATGATNVVMIGGLSYANYLNEWLANEPVDTLNPPQIAASWHSYNEDDSNCSVSDVSCLQANWNNRLVGVPAAVPVVTGEFGEYDCTDTYDDILLPWMTQEGLSHLAWAFNVQATDPTVCTVPPDGLGPTNLISDSTGTPLAGGVGINAYYLQSGIGPY